MILTASMLAASACGQFHGTCGSGCFSREYGSRIDGGNADIHCAGDFHSE